MRAVDIDQFSQLQLRIFFAFSIKHHIQPEGLIKLFVCCVHRHFSLFFAICHFHYNVFTRIDKPCENSVVLLTQVKILLIIIDNEAQLLSCRGEKCWTCSKNTSVTEESRRLFSLGRICSFIHPPRRSSPPIWTFCVSLWSPWRIAPSQRIIWNRRMAHSPIMPAMLR